MASKQSLVKRLFTISRNKFSNQTLRGCLISSLSDVQSMMPRDPDRLSSEPRDSSVFRRFLQRQPLDLSSTASALPEIFHPNREKLLETLRKIDISRNRIRRETKGQLTVADAKKILRASQMEMLKSKLRCCRKSHVSYDEFIQMCVDGCSNRDQGIDLAKNLDNSGSVIVLGNIVLLKPEEVVKVINGLMTKDDLPVKELEEMERWKSEIDYKAEKMVQRELWGGLGYLIVQTAAFMRLTFWELSWDVMEPICFYVTSVYFMVGYAYFIATSREPSFEAVFKSRFRVKQMKLMKVEGFDVEKYNELIKKCR